MPNGLSVERMISFVGDGVFASVLDSQVVVPLQQLGGQAPTLRRALLVLTSQRYRRQPGLAERCAAIRAALPGVAVCLRLRPPFGVPGEAWRWSRYLAAALADLAYTGPAPILVHCRAPQTAAAAGILRRRDPRLRILLDLRGDIVDEVNRAGLLGWHLRRHSRRVLRRALAAADGLNVVSTRLAENLHHDGLLTRELPMAVIGCSVDTQRFHFVPEVRAQRRRELGFDGRFVVCYCGSMAHWQRPDAVAAAYAAIRAGMPDAHLLVLSQEADPLLAHLRAAGVGPEQVTVRAASHTEVASYLMAGDLGLLLRENTRTNQVASPVKFAEYLRCGVPVLLTPYIGDCGALAQRAHVGETIQFPVQPQEALAAARRIRQQHGPNDEFRQHCTRFAEQALSWKAQIPELLRLYERVAGR